MPRIQKFIVMLSLLVVVVLTSGCYTIVGYPPATEGNIVEEESVGAPVYGNYGSYRSYPYSYYRDFYDPYYGLLSPYSYYDDWGYPGSYYGDYNRYYYRNYNYYGDYDYYAPQKKPDVRYRGSSRSRRGSRPESSREIRMEGDEDKKQVNREIRSRPRPESRTQAPARKNRSPVSSSKKRSTKRESQDEEEK